MKRGARLGFDHDKRMMHRLQALLWDVDGTLADTEENGHRPAFNAAFQKEGLDWHWDAQTYRRLLQVSGGRERIRAWMHEQDHWPEAANNDSEAWIEQLQLNKQQFYLQRITQGLIPLRPGIERVLLEAQAAGLRQAVVTTSGRNAVEGLLASHPQLQSCFALMICGEDVSRKKPDPQAYRPALQALGLEGASALAIEDSPQGMKAARGADLAVVITTADWHGEATDLADAALVMDHFDSKPTRLADLRDLLP